MTDPITNGLRHLAESFSVDKREWRQHLKGGDDLLEGLVSHGYAHERGGRYAVNAAGRARLADVDGEVPA
jgi:hypothetical protein